jgi:GNAT superfamily N-acetyltransferase
VTTLIFRTVPPGHPQAAALLEEYFAVRRAEWPAERGRWSPGTVDLSRFMEPRGSFVVASASNGVSSAADPEPVGCGAVRLLDADQAEVKHLYLRAQVRGRGWGGLLLEAVEAEAVRLGARVVVLDTNDTLPAANALYRSAGYAEVERYNDNPNATHWYAKEMLQVRSS